MKKFKKVLLAVPIFVVLCLYFFHHFCSLLTCYSKEETSLEFDHSALMKAPGIMFVETTDRVEPSPLAVCSVESASRRNPDKHVYYFLKGFSGNMSHYPRSQYEAIRVLSLLRNVTVFPLRLRALFRETPLNSWYEQVNPFWEKYWIHVLADACRLALLWKYGGVYLDTDIISLKPLELQNFLCAEGYQTANNAALGFEKNHEFIWECMQDYVRNYEGRTWGYQGPALMSRVLKRWCQSDDLGQFFNLQCKGVSYLSPNYFYPISYTHWESYFQRWKKSSIETFFSETIGAHIWNFKNVGQQKQVITGSGTLIEYFFSQHCPVTYKLLIKRVS
ncbi:alpha-1,4-N-acetylglucosaminyltransferase-like [Chiloscyllium plagiosum]|uniref:alpha-1,4-N-acetylglucosaminyltransferase-like n=1 Tax=Chiloscyllium plagiosum TaxID=36176 RepID=UPI001CB85147|nr:alpha-1,4-N-acetylglucosaminyltransferase-like [Chiloscyllium plagiosum]